MCHSPAESALPDTLLECLREAVPFSRCCWGATDPDSGLPVSHVSDVGTTAHLSSVWENEYLSPDVNKLRLLARTPGHVGVLSQATGGEPWRSVRYRDIFQPLGIEHELRASLVLDRALWGYLVLLRLADEPDFSPAEAAFVSAVAPHLAHALRGVQLQAQLRSEQGVSVPGLVLLDEHDELHGITGEAESLLTELDPTWHEGQRLPEPLYVVAGAARALASGASSRVAPAQGRLRTRAGRWLTLHGSAITSRGTAGQVAVTIQVAETSAVAELLVRAYDFTNRERQVALLVMHGLTNAEIAASLCIAPYTVQDHLKAIFAKAGVQGRRELLQAVFSQTRPPSRQQT